MPEYRWFILLSGVAFRGTRSKRKKVRMKITNKVAVAATAVITAGALIFASPALAHKASDKSSGKATTKVTTSPTPKPPVFGDRDGDRGRHGHGPKGSRTPITKTVTVDVPATGTYQLLVTEVRPANLPTPPAGAPAPKDHSFTVPVTGTGSQTITLNLPHPGDYTVALISVVSTQTVTVTATN